MPVGPLHGALVQGPGPAQQPAVPGIRTQLLRQRLDAFYFGVLPVLSETAGHYGISAAEMARASVTGQPFHLKSPLVPAILLLVSLAKVDLGDHHKKVLWRTAVISLVMLCVGMLTGAIGIG